MKLGLNNYNVNHHNCDLMGQNQFLMKTKNGHILTFSDTLQISAHLCFAACDWFCPMMSQLYNIMHMLFS